MNQEPEVTALQIRHEPDNDVDACRKIFRDKLVSLPSVYVDGQAFVPLRPLCTGLGIDPKDQRKKLRTDHRFTCMDITSVGADGRKRKMAAIAAKEVCAWLFTINSQRVKPEVRPGLIKYQDMLIGMMHEYTTKGYAVNPEMFNDQSYREVNSRLDELLARAESILARTDHLDSLGYGQTPTAEPLQLTSG